MLRNNIKNNEKRSNSPSTHQKKIQNSSPSRISEDALINPIHTDRKHHQFAGHFKGTALRAAPPAAPDVFGKRKII